MNVQGINIKFGADMNGVQSSLSKTNSALKGTQSELQKVGNQLKFDPHNTELLAQKQEVLRKQVEHTRSKLNDYNAMLKEHNKKMSEADEVTEQMQAEHRALVREIEKTQGQLNAYNKSLKDVRNQTSGLGKLKNSYEGIKEKVEQLKDEHPKLIGMLEKTGDAAKKLSSGGFKLLGNAAKGAAVGAAAVGTAAVAAGKAIYGMAKDAAEAGDAIEKTAQKVGLSNEAYQKWDYVMKISGTSMKDCTVGMKTLTGQIDKAKNGTNASIDTFKKLGISVDDLNKMSREDAFAAVIKGLQGMKDSTERAAIANQLFGKSGQNLTPLFNQSSAETQRLMDNMDDLGMIMSDKAVAASAKFQDSLTELQASFGGIKNGLVSELLPGMTTFIEGLTGILTGEKGADKKLLDGLDSMMDSCEVIIPKFEDILYRLVDAGVEVAPKIIVSLGNGIIEHLDELLGSALEIVTTLSQGLLTEDNIKIVMSSAVSLLLNLTDFLSDNVDLVVDSSFLIIESLIDGLLEDDNMDKLVNTSMDIVVKLATSMIDNIPELINAAGKMALALGEALLDYDWWSVVKRLFNSLKGSLKSLVTSFGGGNDDPKNLNGSHANGLSYVPFDGYIAELHKGERVLTREENINYSGGSCINLTLHIENFNNNSAQDINRLADELSVVLASKMQRKERAYA